MLARPAGHPPRELEQAPRGRVWGGWWLAAVCVVMVVVAVVEKVDCDLCVASPLVVFMLGPAVDTCLQSGLEAVGA